MVVTHLVTRQTFSENNIIFFSLLRFSLIKNFGAGPAALLRPSLIKKNKHPADCRKGNQPTGCRTYVLAPIVGIVEDHIQVVR